MSDLSNHRLAPGVDAGRRTAPRTVVGMSGHYVLNGWRDAEGAPRRFPCSIRNMSPKVLTITAPVSGSVGEWIVASFEKLGQFEGPILQVLNRALAMRIVATNEDRAKVAKKIAWLTGATNAEARRFPRIVPADPHTAMKLSTEQSIPCLVIDYSVSGVAVAADVTPDIGTIVKIGTVLGRVVRHVEGGFAVAFLTLQEPHLIEEHILSLPE